LQNGEQWYPTQEMIPSIVQSAGDFVDGFVMIINGALDWFQSELLAPLGLPNYSSPFCFLETVGNTESSGKQSRIEVCHSLPQIASLAQFRRIHPNLIISPEGFLE
jgi:hypothetical protein